MSVNANWSEHYKGLYVHIKMLYKIAIENVRFPEPGELLEAAEGATASCELELDLGRAFRAGTGLDVGEISGV